MTLDDAVLVNEFVKGNEDAFSQLVRRYQSRIVNYFFRLSWERETAEDLAQDVFIKVYSSLKRSLPKIPFSCLLFRVAKLHWYDYLRKKYRSVKTQGKIEEYCAILPQKTPDNLDGDWEERQELIAKMLIACEQLPSEQRLVIELAYFLKIPYKDISEILEIPIGTVKSRLNSSIKRLRRMMESDSD